jgi:hypothetical protein
VYREGAARSAWGCTSVESGRALTPSVLRRFDAEGGLMPASASGLRRGCRRSAAALNHVSGTACLPSISRAWSCACPPGRTPVYRPACLSLASSGHFRGPALPLRRSAPPMLAKSEAHAPTAPNWSNSGQAFAHAHLAVLRETAMSTSASKCLRPLQKPVSRAAESLQLNPSYSQGRCDAERTRLRSGGGKCAGSERAGCVGQVAGKGQTWTTCGGESPWRATVFSNSKTRKALRGLFKSQFSKIFRATRTGPSRPKVDNNEKTAPRTRKMVKRKH